MIQWLSGFWGLTEQRIWLGFFKIWMARSVRTGRKFSGRWSSLWIEASVISVQVKNKVADGLYASQEWGCYWTLCKPRVRMLLVSWWLYFCIEDGKCWGFSKRIEMRGGKTDNRRRFTGRNWSAHHWPQPSQKPVAKPALLTVQHLFRHPPESSD